jgi:hypothetical protein
MGYFKGVLTMSVRVIIIAFLLLLLVPAGSQDNQISLASELTVDESTIPNSEIITGSISGHVYEADGVTPIINAMVTALGIEGTYGGVGLHTNNDGSYSINSLMSGNYHVYAQASGYLLEYYDNTIKEAEATPVIVAAPNDTKNIDFTLDTGGSISGHVYGPDGITPLANVSINANEIAFPGHSGYATTAYDGSYTITTLPTADYRVSCHEEGYLDQYYDKKFDSQTATPVSVDNPLDTSDIDFVLDVGGSISGHVYQSDGITTINNVDIQIYKVNGNGGGTATTSIDGSYSVTGLSTGNYSVSTNATGYLTRYYNAAYIYDDAIPIKVNYPENTSGIDFIMDNGGSISGHVYKSDGITPMANVYISTYNIVYPQTRGSAITTGDGSYLMTGLVPGNYWLLAGASGYPDQYYSGATPIKVTVNNITSGINFILAEGGSISGHVYQSDGVTPVAGAAIFTSGATATSSEDGSYTLTTLPSGKYRIQVYVTGYLPQYYDNTGSYDDALLVNVDAPHNTTGIDFVLNPLGSISGHVYQSDGTTPFAGALVYAQGRSSTSTPDGSYTISSLPSGYYQPYVTATGYITLYYGNAVDYRYANWVRLSAPDNTPDIDFTLRKGGSISGHVYQPDGIMPIGNAQVYVELTENMFVCSRYATVEADGSYSISGLIPGKYRVKACSAKYVTEYYHNVFVESMYEAVIVTSEYETTGIDFVMGIGGSISGHIYRPDGVSPIVYGSVYAESDENDVMRISEISKDGSYTLSWLPPGTYLISAYASGYLEEFYNGVFEREEALPVHVTEDQNINDIDISLDIPGFISGNVYQADGVTPIYRAFIEAKKFINDTWTAIQSTQSLLDGSYTFASLSPDLYKLFIWKEGYIDQYYGGAYEIYDATPVVVALSQETSGINFTMDTGGTISGHVYQPDGVTPLASAAVIASPGDIRTTSYHDGSYTIRGLPTGNYQVSTVAQGFISEYYNGVYYAGGASAVSVVADYDTPNIDFVLETGGSISGHVYQSDGVSPIYEGFQVTFISTESETRVFELPLPYVPNNGITHYKESDLPPGYYRVYASAPGYISEYYDDVFVPDEGSLVQVIAGQDTSGINFLLEKSCDVNGDGKTGIGDILYLELSMLGLQPPTIYMDVDGDGRIGIGDILKIEMMMLGKG